MPTGSGARQCSVSAKEHVTRLVRDLSLDSESRGALAKAGAIPELARQLRDGTPTGQSLAGAALSHIALRSPEVRVQASAESGSSQCREWLPCDDALTDLCHDTDTHGPPMAPRLASGCR